MTPVVTGARMSGARHRAELPLLVLGPSLGTSAGALWTDCAHHLADDFDVLAWDLPGHGHNRSVPDEPLTMAELAAGVLALVADVQEQRGDAGSPFAYAGVSVGGAVGPEGRDDVEAVPAIGDVHRVEQRELGGRQPGRHVVPLARRHAGPKVRPELADPATPPGGRRWHWQAG